MTITLTREEAQQVLDALRAVEDLTTHDDEVYAAIDIIEPLLAQPEPEPAAWGVLNTRPTEKAQFMMLLHSTDGVQYPDLLVPLYTAPPQREWQGLTDDEIIDAANNAPFDTMVSAEDYIYVIARAIEAKLKEKNT